MFFGCFVVACRWRQLLQFSPTCIMCPKISAIVVLCFICIASVSEGFFIPASIRKQAPQTAALNNPQWASPSNGGSNNGPANAIQSGYGNFKDFGHYQPQQPQPVQQQQQQQQQPPPPPPPPQSPTLQQQQQQLLYSSQLQSVHPTALKYEPAPYPSQFPYDGYASYPQSVQLVPCLCPVTKEILEQQSQQQSAVQVSPTTGSFPTETNNNNSNGALPAAQGAQKKTS